MQKLTLRSEGTYLIYHAVDHDDAQRVAQAMDRPVGYRLDAGYIVSFHGEYLADLRTLERTAARSGVAVSVGGVPLADWIERLKECIASPSIAAPITVEEASRDTSLTSLVDREIARQMDQAETDVEGGPIHSAIIQRVVNRTGAPECLVRERFYATQF